MCSYTFFGGFWSTLCCCLRSSVFNCFSSSWSRFSLCMMDMMLVSCSGVSLTSSSPSRSTTCSKRNNVIMWKQCRDLYSTDVMHFSDNITNNNSKNNDSKCPIGVHNTCKLPWIWALKALATCIKDRPDMSERYGIKAFVECRVSSKCLCLKCWNSSWGQMLMLNVTKLITSWVHNCKYSYWITSLSNEQSVVCQLLHTDGMQITWLGVSRPPILDCGTIFHPDHGEQDRTSTPLDNLWNLIYLATEALSDYWIYRCHTNKLIYLHNRRSLWCR